MSLVTLATSAGIALDAPTADVVVLKSSFDHMFSKDFCGSKAVDFAMSLPCTTVLLIHSDNIHESMRNYEQLFRRVLQGVSRGQAVEVVLQTTMLPHSSTSSLNDVHDEILNSLRKTAEDLGLEVRW
jgi:hypothetical protein